MTKKQQLEKERELLVTLQEHSLKMFERLKNNKEHEHLDFERAKYIISRLFHNELDYLDREADDYYELYVENYYNQ